MITNNTVPELDIIANEWEDFSMPFWLYDNELPIAAMAEVSPIRITCKYHGKSTNDKVIVAGVQCDDGRWSNANGIQVVTFVDANTLTLNSTTTNGASSRQGGIIATPRNCTGGSIAIELRLSPDDVDPLEQSFAKTTLVIAEGNFKISMSASDLHDMVIDDNDEVYYDLFYIDAASVRHREMKGKFTINKSITKG